MKLNIYHRLFIPVLLTAVLVSAVGLGLVKTSVERSFSRYVTEIELSHLGLMVALLKKDYREKGAWPTIPESERQIWVKERFADLHQLPAASLSELLRDPEAAGDIPKRVFGTPDPAQLFGLYGVPLGSRSPVGFPPLLPRPDSWQEPGAGSDGPPPDPAGFHAGDPPPYWGGAAPFEPFTHGPDKFRLEDRVGLLDANGQYLAGVIPDNSGSRRVLQVDGKIVGYLWLSQAVDPSDALARTFVNDQSRNLLLIVLVCIVLSAIAAGLLAAHFRRPISRLLEGAQRLALGHFDMRLDIRRSDELGALANTFNDLATILERHEASRRQWVADTSHELRTPLAVLRAQIEALQDGLRTPDHAQFMAMHRQVMALQKLIGELYELANSGVGQLAYRMVLIDPWAITVAEAEGFRDRFIRAGLQLHIDLSNGGFSLMGDPDRFHQISANFLENSLRYTDPGGRVLLSSQRDGSEWSFSIEDSAPGVPEHALASLAERFYRVESSRSRALGGSGLGLSLCQRMVEAHGGSLRFTHSSLGGLKVTITFRQEQAI